LKGIFNNISRFHKLGQPLGNLFGSLMRWNIQRRFKCRGQGSNEEKSIMGSLNLHPIPEIFNSGCIICGSTDVTPLLGDASRSCYEYICKVCNPKVTIVVTDLLAMDELIDDLVKNDKAKSRIHEDIKHFDGKEYELGLELATYFLDLEFKNREYTYDDWWEGKLGGNLNLSNISQEEQIKIETKQSEILNDKVEEFRDKLIQDFEENSTRVS